MNRWLVLTLFLLACFAVAGTAAWLTRSSVNSWYPTIQKPSWNPPNWLFGPVWTVLYIMMAIAGWKVWQLQPGSLREFLLAIFWVQLFLNFLWSPLFFRFHAIGIAAVEIVFLWLAIGAFVICAWRGSPAAAFLFVPYWLWVSFAAFLNFTIWQLNRTTGGTP